MGDSIRLAKNISGEVDKYVLKLWPGTKNLGVKKAPFFVLMGAHMPCVLVELFFVDNQFDGNNIKKPSFKSDLTYSLFSGIKKFLKETRK